MPDDCLFCKIIAGEIPSTTMLDRETVTAFRDIAPAAPVHVLIVPKEHISDVRDLEHAHGGILVDLFQAANDIAQHEAVDRSGYRLLFNVGPDAGQTVFHLHMHLVGGKPLGGVGPG
ncbi:MAG: histidine triad nucleotide-binding protein [Actinomycetota bacterium]